MLKQDSCILQHQTSCSVVLSSALQLLFPSVQLLGFGATDNYFFCDFILPFPFQNTMLSVLEERIQNLIDKHLDLIPLEMEISNAIEFFNFHDQLVPFEWKEKKDNCKGQIVSIIQCDRFLGQSPGKCLRNTGEIQKFKLIKWHAYNDKGIRLIGCCQVTKEALKTSIQKLKNWQSHIFIVQQLNFFMKTQAGWIWLPKGQEVKNSLLKEIKNLFPSIQTLVSPAFNEKHLYKIHKNYLLQSCFDKTIEEFRIQTSENDAELLTAKVKTNVYCFFKEKDEQTLISCLQTIVKFLKILSFEIEIHLGRIEGALKDKLLESLEDFIPKVSVSGILRKGIEIYTSDGLGRKWMIFRMMQEESAIFSFVFYALERWIALEIEKTQGILPRFLHRGFGTDSENTECENKAIKEEVKF